MLNFKFLNVIKYVYYRPLGNYSLYIFQEFELIYKGITIT